MNLGAIKYDRVVSADDGSSVAKLLKWIKPKSKVLECGPATGIMTKILKNELDCKITAIEIDPEAAELAKPFCDKMIVGNLEAIDFESELNGEKFDYIIFADVLEHLSNPLEVLKKIKSYLDEDGEVLISIPNISHAVILGELIQGKFDYQKDGLLDHTHLRFFTRKSLIELCKSAEATIIEWDRTVREPASTEFSVSFQQLPESVKSLFKSYPDSDTYQFLARVSTSNTAKEAEHENSVPEVNKQNLPSYLTSVMYFSESSYFSEENSSHKIIKQDERKVELKFSIPGGTKNIRFDPVDTKEAFALLSLEIMDPGQKPIWKWTATSDQGNNYYTQNISETRGINSVLSFPLNNDPQIHIHLKTPLKAACTFKATLSFDVPYYFEDFAKGIKEIMDAKQKQLDEYYIDNQALRTALSAAASEIMEHKAIAAEARKTVDNRKSEIEHLHSERHALLDRINHLNKILDGMWTSKSWKLTRPLRAAGIIYRSVRGIKRKLKQKFLDKLRLRAYKNYTLFKYLSDNNYLSSIERYQIWTAHQEIPDLSKPLKYQPKISIILPVYKTPLPWLKECIQSVIRQTYENWELCIADDFSDDPGIRSILSTYEASDKRIKVVYRKQNGHIAECSQSALEVASGEFICLLDHDDLLHKDALYWVASKLNDDNSLDFIYSNEDKLTLDGNFDQPAFKPGWSPEYFLSFMYTGHLATYRTSLAKKVGGFRKGTEGSQDYDLTLRVTEATNKIAHIPKVLYHWREHPDSIALNLHCKDYAFQAAERSLTSHINKLTGTPAVVFNGNFKGIYRMKSTAKCNFDISAFDKNISPSKFKKFLAECLKKSGSGTIVIHRDDCSFSNELPDLLCSPLNINEVAASSPVLTHGGKVVSCGYGIFKGKVIPLLKDSDLSQAGFGARLAAMHNTALVTLDYLAIKKSALNAAMPSIERAGSFTAIAMALSTEILKSGQRIVLVPEKVDISNTEALVSGGSAGSKFNQLSDPYLSKHIDFDNKSFSYV